MNLQKVINASGRMSILGVSTIAEPILEAMNTGAKNFYVMEQLHKEAGVIIANYLDTEAAMVTNSASSGIALSIAGFITKDNPTACHNLYDSEIYPRREVLLMKGQHVDYGAPVGLMVQIGGGEIKEAGFANGCSLTNIAAAVSKNTICLLYIQSHHAVQKNMPSVEEVGGLAKELGLPLVLDAAAEENWHPYCEHADLVIISGSKALGGPTSGIIAGNKQYIEAIQIHNSGIGRAMKVGKESIFGLIKAVEVYGDTKVGPEEQQKILQELLNLEKVPGILFSIQPDATGREIYRGKIMIDKKKTGISAAEITKQLRQGDIAIYTRDYDSNMGSFEIDPRSVTKSEMQIIANRVTELCKGGERE